MITPSLSFPVIIVNNLSATKDFYLENLSFSVAFENDWYLHLVSESGIQVGFMLPNQPSQPEQFHTGYSGDGVIFSLEVEDADSAYQFAQKRDLNIILTLREEEWGQKHFSIQDPNGLFIDIVQPIEPSAEFQQGYTN